MKLSLQYDRQLQKKDGEGKIEQLKDSHSEIGIDLSKRPKVIREHADGTKVVEK